MILGILTLLIALGISSVSAFYSILGLTAIFAGAFWPIVIMGATLEAGKIASAVWLHYNWERADWKIKTYLVSAVVILMLITSLGVFGFLSKAHSEQAVPTGDIQAQVSLFDEKIKTQRDNIDSARRVLAQMDGAVDQVLARSTTDTGASKSAALRKSQLKERIALQKDIDEAQKQIAVLQEERAPIASKMRQVIADVGPVTYLAALIYGDSADQNLLEAAVRWVIIIIVFVFDPLAIVLILAATTSMDWAKEDRRKRRHEKIEEAKEEKRDQDELAAIYQNQDPVLRPPTPNEDAVTKAQVDAMVLKQCHVDSPGLDNLVNNIINKTEKLGEPYESALYTNLFELYETENKEQDKANVFYKSETRREDDTAAPKPEVKPVVKPIVEDLRSPEKVTKVPQPIIDKFEPVVVEITEDPVSNERVLTVRKTADRNHVEFVRANSLLELPPKTDIEMPALEVEITEDKIKELVRHLEDGSISVDDMSEHEREKVASYLIQHSKPQRGNDESTSN